MAANTLQIRDNTGWRGSACLIGDDIVTIKHVLDGVDSAAQFVTILPDEGVKPPDIASVNHYPYQNSGNTDGPVIIKLNRGHNRKSPF